MKEPTPFFVEIASILLIASIIALVKYIIKYTHDTSGNEKKVFSDEEITIINTKKNEKQIRNSKWQKYQRTFIITLFFGPFLVFITAMILLFVFNISI